MKLSIITTAILFGISGAAMADDNGFYLYGSAGKSTASLNQGDISSDYANTGKLNLANVSSSVSANPTAYQLQLGYQFNKNSAIEAGYGGTDNLTYTLTKPTSAQESEKTRIFDLVYAATIPLDSNFAITSRAGLAYVRSSGDGAIRSFDGHATRITGGLGMKFSLTDNLSLRADWNGYSAPSAAKIDGNFINLFTVGVGYKF